MEQQKKIVSVIWIAFMVSIVGFVVASQVLVAKSDAGGEASGFLLQIFIGIGVMNILLGHFLPNFLLQQVSATPSVNESALLMKIYPLFVVRMALFESVAILGFALTSMTGDSTLVIGFSIVALVAMALHRPRVERWLEPTQPGASRTL